MALKDFYKEFPKREDCIVLLEKLKWDGSPQCPYCGSGRHTELKNSKRLHCNNCNMSFSVTVGTIFHRTRLDLQKWFYAINIILSSTDKISSRELAKKIESTKDTAWLVLRKVKNAILINDDLVIKIRDYEN